MSLKSLLVSRVNLILDKFFILVIFFNLKISGLFFINEVTCSLSSKDFPNLYAFANDLKLNISISKPSG